MPLRRASGSPQQPGRRPDIIGGTSRAALGVRLQGAPSEGVDNSRQRREGLMSIEENKAVVGRWFTEFWGQLGLITEA